MVRQCPTLNMQMLEWKKSQIPKSVEPLIKKGRFDKTADWGQTHVLILNCGVHAQNINRVVFKAKKDGVELDNDMLSAGILLLVSAHEYGHTLCKRLMEKYKSKHPDAFKVFQRP